MAKTPSSPKKPGDKTPKSKAPNSKASRPDVQPIGPALAELLNPAINRGEAGVGSTTGARSTKEDPPPPPPPPPTPGGGERGGGGAPPPAAKQDGSAWRPGHGGSAGSADPRRPA